MTEQEKTDRKFMRACLRLAQRAAANGDVPVGCVITCEDKIVAREYNKRERNDDPTAHAEIVALKKAGKRLGRKNLSGCTLYVTLEPCVMCAGAIINSRVDRVVFGAYDARFGCVGSIMNLVTDERFNHRASVTGGVLEKKCSALLTEFFRALRENKRKTESELN